MNPAGDKEIEKGQSGVEERIEGVEAQLDELEEKLEDDVWEKELLEVIDGAVRHSASEALERDLVEALNGYFQDGKMGQLILNVLANNNPYVFKPLGIELQPSTVNFFEKISRRYGTKVKNSIKSYYTPNDWRYVNSEARKGGKYQGKRLESKILKWDGSTCKVTSNLPDTVKLATHLIDNLLSKFDSFEEAKSEQILAKLDNLESSIERLRDQIRSDIES
jgi:hypothetical protein